MWKDVENALAKLLIETIDHRDNKEQDTNADDQPR